MAIIIPKKQQPQQPEDNDKQLRGKLLNGLRILAFNHYKKLNYKSGLDGTQMYQNFREEWFNDPIHNLDLVKIQELIKELGYTQQELFEIINDYYTKQNHFLLYGKQTYQRKNVEENENVNRKYS